MTAAGSQPVAYDIFDFPLFDVLPDWTMENRLDIEADYVIEKARALVPGREVVWVQAGLYDDGHKFRVGVRRLAAPGQSGIISHRHDR